MRTATQNPPIDAAEADSPNRPGQPVNYSARIWTGFAVALASLLLVGAVGIYSARALINRDGWVSHTRIVIDRLAAIDSNLKSAQGSMLGYAASGDGRFLRRAQVAGAALDREVGRLPQLIGDNPEQVQRAAHLEALLDARRELVHRTIAIVSKSGFSAAASGILHGPGAVLTAEISRQVAAMNTVELELLAAHDVAAASAAKIALVLLAFGSLLGVSLVGLSGLFIVRSLGALRLRNRELAHSEQRKEQLNQELGVKRASAVRYARNLEASKGALQDQTALLHAILDGMADGVIARGGDGRLLLSNRAARRILPGGSFDSESGFASFLADYEPFLDGFETPAPLAEIPLSRAMRGLAVDNVELYLRSRSTGEKLCLEISARPLRNQRGEQFGAMVVFRNIAGRRQSEREQARLAAVVQSSSDAIISGLPSGVIASFNSGAERLFGYSASEVIGLNLAILEPSDNVGEIAQSIARCFTRRCAVHFETRRMRKGGVCFDADVIDSPIYDAGGSEIGFSAIVRDISERKYSERILAERTRDLERSNVELEQFAYLASHDLQEPLRMIGSYVQLLRDRYRGHLDSDADEFIEFAVDGAVRMKQLINDLLLYSRAGRGHVGAVVEASAALDWATANLALKIRDSAAVIIRGEMPLVVADPAQLGQLFQNLIDNALKFHGEGPPKIEVEAMRRGDLWEFCVRDNGIGIAQRHAARVFQMFRRLHSSDEYPGTGIGLAICRKIAERNGGSIWVDAEAHPGTAFRFTIPAVSSESAAKIEG